MSARAGAHAHPAGPAAAAATPVGGADSAPWTLRLLGGFELANTAQRHTKLGTRAAMALLARLCLRPGSAHPRETLVELLWPGVAAEAGRQRLRQTLSTLKQVLEPAGEPGFAVIEADRLNLRLVAGSVWCDALAFEAAYKRGDHEAAHAHYAGELLPGFFDEWISDERLRLEGLFDRLRPPAAQPLAAAPAAPAAPAGPAGPAAPAGLAVPAALAAPASSAPATSPPSAPASAAAATGPTAGPTAGPQRAPLPAYLTRLIGADPQATRLRQQVAEHRLVTLMGPGGTGKTRMAVEVAQSLEAEGGFELVVFVPLAACRTRQALLDQLLLSLHLAQGRTGALDTAMQALDGRRALLVLDNVEQVVDDGAEVVAGLGMRLPLLHQLVTSRRALAIAGEREITVAALDLPQCDATLAEAAANPAVSLFVDRARAARAEFHLHEANRAAVIELVQLLDGMPLAIELAGARVRSLTPAEMAATLRAARADADDSGGGALTLLARAPVRGRADTRHHSMQQTIAWSWDLLDDGLRTLLAALTVFNGGFTAAAAHAVCGGTTSQVGRRLDDLLSHSLLRVHTAEDSSDALRFGMYEPIREFAHRTLAPSAAAQLRHRVRAWAVAWGHAMPATPPLVALRAELPNFVAAMASAVADGAPQDAIAIALALQPALDHEALPAAAQAALEAGLQATSAAPGTEDAARRVRVLVLLGLAWFRQGRAADAQRAVAEAVALATPAQPSARARALVAAFTVAFNAGGRGPELLAWLDEAQALAASVNDVQNSARAAAARSDLISQTGGSLAECEALHRQALATWQAQGHALSMLRARIGLAQLWMLDSRYDVVQAEMDAVIDSARRQQFWRLAAEALHLRGAALSRLRRHGDALAALGDSVSLSWRALDSYIALRAMWTLLPACARREPAAAQQLAGAMHALWLQRFARLTLYQRAAMTWARRMAHVQLGPAASAAAFDAGQRLTLAQAVSLALQIARQGLGHPPPG